ncbi:ead/Ea22-like family protein [Citrobacter freundii]
MSNIDKRALREAAQEEIMLRSVSDTSDAWQDEASPEAVLALLDELEAAEKRIAELEANKGKPVMFIDGDISASDAEKLAEVIREMGRRTSACITGGNGSLEVAVKQFDDFKIVHYGATEDYAKGYIDCQNNYNKALAAAGIGVKGE